MSTNDELMQLWGESEFDENAVKTFANLPDGKYEAKVDVARFDKTNSGKNKIAYELTVVKPEEFAGRKIFHNKMIDTKEQIGWAREEFHKIGITHATMTDVQTGLAGLIGATLEVSAKLGKPNPPYEARVNYYLNKRLEDAPEVYVDPFA